MRSEYRLIVGTLVTAEVCSAFESTMVFAALGSWIRSYKDPVTVGWIVTSYLLVAGSSAAIAGRLGDMFGRRRVLMCLLLACVIGSTVSASADSAAIVIAGRSIQGLAGGILPLVYALAREHLPKDVVPVAIGIIVAGATLSGSTGLILGGLLTDNFGPNSVFWASMICALISLAGVWSFVPRTETARYSGRIDVTGGVLFAPMIALILFGVGSGNHSGWTSPTVMGAIGAGIAGLIVWAWHELRVEEPLIDVRLLRNRDFLIANAVMFCLAVGTMQILQLFSLLLQQPVWTSVGLGLTATMFGLMKIPSMLSGTLSSLISGWSCARFGPRAPILIGTIATTAGLTLATFFHGSIPIIILVLITATAGTTLAYAAIPNVVMNAVPEGRTGEATGVLAVFRSMARAIGSQVLVLLLATSTLVDPSSGAKFAADSGYILAFIFMSATSLLALLLTLALPSERPREAPRPAAAH